MIKTSRRSLLIGGLATLITAPAIVRATNIMPVKVFKERIMRFTVYGIDHLGNPMQEIFDVPEVTLPWRWIAHLTDNTQMASVTSLGHEIIGKPETFFSTIPARDIKIIR